MAGHAYVGDSGEDRAFSKLEKILDKSEKRVNKLKTLSEQIAEANDKSFHAVYDSFGIWEDEVKETFARRYHLHINTRCNSDFFSTPIIVVLRDLFKKELVPHDAVKELAKYCTML